MRPNRFSGLAAVAVAVWVVGLGASPGNAAPPPVTAGQEGVIAGSVTPGLDVAQRLAPLDPGQRVEFTVVLVPRDAAGLAGFVTTVSDPRSPDHGKYLTPATFADRFGATPETVGAVRGYLERSGLSVTSVDPNRLGMHVAGTAGEIRTAFGTTLAAWRDPGSASDYVAIDSAPRLPVAIAGSVAAVLGLDNHHPLRHHAIPSTIQENHVGTGHYGYAPADLRTAYDVNPALETGSGQAVGLYELNGYNAQNVRVYQDYYGLPHASVTPIAVDGFPIGATPGRDQIEVELDIEVVNALAPGASVKVWEGYNGAAPGQPANAVLDGTYDVYSRMVNDNLTRVNSTSWGDCEPHIAPAYRDAVHTLLEQGAAQGQTWFAASGDYGVFDCSPPSSSKPATVDYPASDTAMTGVGGTRLTTAPGQVYAGESGWGSAANPLQGGGGGVSGDFGRTDWQSGSGVPSSPPRRLVPDVSLDSDPATGYDIYTTFGGQTGWLGVGGTSAAAPAWAAFAALYDNYAAARGRPSLGFANPALYRLAAATQSFPPFHDVLVGTNGTYSAGPGWDYMTGLGSYDAYAIARDLAPGPALPYPPPASASASGGAGFASVAWSPAPGTINPVLRYTVTAAPGGQVASVGPAASSAVLYGLDPNIYTFAVTAVYTGGSAATVTNATATGQFVPAPRRGAPWDGGSDAVGVSTGATDAYFAEGTTQAGFDEYLTIQTTVAQAVTVDYLFTDGSMFSKLYNLPAASRSTLYVNREVGPGRDVALHVYGNAPLVAERPLYFNFNGITGGHDVVGAAALGSRFLFAEGSTRPGFHEYLTLLNTADAQANVSVHYFANTGPLAPITHSLAPNSRTTIDVNSEAGANLDLAVEVDSDIPILVERPFYFSFNGWTGGHVVIGASGPSTTANLAEGFVRAGSFSEYLTILNPGPAGATVDLAFLLPGGSSFSGGQVFVAAGSRSTVAVNSILPDGTASSVHVSSTAPIVVERPLYFSFQGINGGHDAVAIPDSALAPTANLAEGFTGSAFREYLTILNPGPISTTATVTYYVADSADGSTQVIKRPYSLLMHSRTTIDVNFEIGPNKAVSVRVDTNPDLPGTGPATPIEVERPLYFAY